MIFKLVHSLTNSIKFSDTKYSYINNTEIQVLTRHTYIHKMNIKHDKILN